MKQEYLTFNGENLISLGECDCFDEACAKEEAFPSRESQVFSLPQKATGKKFWRIWPKISKIEVDRFFNLLYTPPMNISFTTAELHEIMRESYSFCEKMISLLKKDVLAEYRAKY